MHLERLFKNPRPPLLPSRHLSLSSLTSSFNHLLFQNSSSLSNPSRAHAIRRHRPSACLDTHTRTPTTTTPHTSCNSARVSVRIISMRTKQLMTGGGRTTRRRRPAFDFAASRSPSQLPTGSLSFGDCSLGELQHPHGLSLTPDRN